ncbi:hypothetical protein BH23THE1_BH23THE1_12380 [soil metagenome]
MQYCNMFKDTMKLFDNAFFIEFNLTPPCWAVNTLIVDIQEQINENLEQKVKYKKIIMLLKYCPFCSGVLEFSQ